MEVLKIPKFRYVKRERDHGFNRCITQKYCSCIQREWLHYPELLPKPKSLEPNSELKSFTPVVYLFGEIRLYYALAEWCETESIPEITQVGEYGIQWKTKTGTYTTHNFVKL